MAGEVADPVLDMLGALELCTPDLEVCAVPFSTLPLLPLSLSLHAPDNGGGGGLELIVQLVFSCPQVGHPGAGSCYVRYWHA